MTASFVVGNPDGFALFDAGKSVALILGSALIGGANQAQSGSFQDPRLPLGRPYFLVTSLEVNSFIGYRPNVTFSGTTISWEWPANYAGAPYPRARFIYGLK